MEVDFIFAGQLEINSQDYCDLQQEHSVEIHSLRFETEVKKMYLDPVHITPFSNENSTVLLHFQNDSRPH